MLKKEKSLPPTICTSHASLKRTRKLVAPNAKNETRKKNANNPARLLQGALCFIRNANQ